jgi:hypothetical protein
MIDLLQNFENADVLSASPSGSVHKGRLAKVFLQIQTEREGRRPYSRR